MNDLKIRLATIDDVETIHYFITQLAIYEKMSDQVCSNADTLRETLFEKRQAEVVLGEVDGVCVGFALFFHNFSTFQGRKGLYLEDLFVLEEYRGKGYGKALLLHLAKIAVERNCRRMEWVVLDWNTPAIEFYRSLGAVSLEQWTIHRLDYDTLLKLTN